MNPLDQIVSAAILIKQTFSTPTWLIPNILPVGLTLLAGKSKMGKSWLSLGLGVDLAAQNKSTLYLALEDTSMSLQGRLLEVCGEKAAPDNLFLFTGSDWPRIIDGEGLTRLNEWMVKYPATKLIIIDTFAKIKPRTKPGANEYDIDYNTLTKLKSLADEHKIGILIIHHLRKSVDPEDPFTGVLGSTALQGCPDTILILDRQRQSNKATLHITGRQMEEQALEMLWDPETCRWRIYRESSPIETSEVGKEVVLVLQEAGKPLTLREIVNLASVRFSRPESTIKGRLSRMVRTGTLLYNEKLYSLPVYSESTESMNLVCF